MACRGRARRTWSECSCSGPTHYPPRMAPLRMGLRLHAHWPVGPVRPIYLPLLFSTTNCAFEAMQ